MIQQLDPGMYLVGREDCGIPSFFVIVEPDGICMSGQEVMAPAAEAMVDFTKGGGRWWWQRMIVPHSMPTQEYLDSIPRFPLARRGL